MSTLVRMEPAQAKKSSALVAFVMLLTATACSPGGDGTLPAPNPDAAPSLDSGVGSSAANGGPAQDADWRAALEHLARANVAAYSYRIFEGDPSKYPGAKEGVTLTLRPGNQAKACAAAGPEGGVPPEGWYLRLMAADTEKGRYQLSPGRGSLAFSEKETMDVVGQLQRSSHDESKSSRYIAADGWLELDNPVVAFKDRDSAMPLSGSIHLSFSTTAVNPRACSTSFEVATQKSFTRCECLIDDSKIVECIPEGPQDECCLKEVSNERFEVDIRFEAEPCAANCAASSGPAAQFCNILMSSDFDDTSSP